MLSERQAAVAAIGALFIAVGAVAYLFRSPLAALFGLRGHLGSDRPGLYRRLDPSNRAYRPKGSPTQRLIVRILAAAALSAATALLPLMVYTRERIFVGAFLLAAGLGLAAIGRSLYLEPLMTRLRPIEFKNQPTEEAIRRASVAMVWASLTTSLVGTLLLVAELAGV